MTEREDYQKVLEKRVGMGWKRVEKFSLMDLERMTEFYLVVLKDGGISDFAIFPSLENSAIDKNHDYPFDLYVKVTP
jgi:hypothetical protein